MGKDEACCDACRQFGDGAVTTELDTPAMVVTAATRPWLVVEGGPAVPIDGETWVGRGSQNHVVLRSDAISRRQCVLAVRDGKVLVADGSSTCGTYVDGRQITEPTVVRDGSVIYIANYRLRVELR